MLRLSFRKYMHETIDAGHNTMRTLWSQLKSLGLAKDKNRSNQLTVSSDKLIAHFTPNEANKSPLINATSLFYRNNVLVLSEKFYFKDVSVPNVLHAINSLSSNAIGDDSISIKMIKPLADLLCPILVHIFNYSLQSFSYPDIWKRGLIRPIPKISTPETASDYRPISVLPVFGKLLEKIVYDQILSYIEKHKIIDVLQSGFKKLHSTGTALLRITEDIRRAKCNNEVTIIVLFDFSKAFDSVVHDILLSKLSHLNFSYSAVRWVESYLTNRMQCINENNNNNNSKWLTCNCGVPQGSVLGPLLYSLYTYDIGSCFSLCKYHLFADDLQIYVHCKVDEISECVNKINTEILRLVNWTEKHGLTLNPKKTQAMIIKNRTHINTANVNKIVINGVPVEYSTKIKNLGIIIDENLSWSSHVSSICQRSYLALFHLYKFRSLTPFKTRIRLVNSLILPLYDYCNFVYCDINNSGLNRLQVSLNNAVRYIFDIKPREHITKYYIKLGWLKISERRDVGVCVMMHKILNNCAPEYLNDLVTVMSTVCSRETRSHKLYLQAPLVGKEVPEGSFAVMGYRLWNGLKPELYSLSLTKLFRKKLEYAFLMKYK
jgi:hypothetical protein